MKFSEDYHDDLTELTFVLLPGVPPPVLNQLVAEIRRATAREFCRQREGMIARVRVEAAATVLKLRDEDRARMAARIDTVSPN